MSELYTTVHPNTPIEVRGYETPDKRVLLRQIVHAGIKPAIGREVRLVLDAEGLEKLAMELLEAIPLNRLSRNERLQKVIKMLAVE